MPVTEIRFDELKPYASVLLAAISGGARRAVFTELIGQLRDGLGLDDDVGGNRAFVSTRGPETVDELEVGILHYVERSPPSWLLASSDAVRDELNHLVVVCRRGKYVAIFSSDPRAKQLITRAVKHEEGLDLGVGGFGRLAPIDFRVLNAAFVDGPTRTLWLTGIHRRTPVKADSKVLAGLSLESALDPLDDQSYHFTSARCLVTGPDGEVFPAGVTPRNSRVWAGPTRSWENFLSRISALLALVEDAETDDRRVDAPLPILAMPVSRSEDVFGAYDMSVIAPELLADEGAGNLQAREEAERWSYESRLTVHAGDGPNLSVDVVVAGEHVGAFTFDVTMTGLGQARFHVEATGPVAADGLVEEALRVLRRRDWITIHYESGHSLSHGALYSVRHRDLPFENWRFVDLAGFDATREKPLEGQRFRHDLIGQEDSLFSWIQQHWPLDGEVDRGWLACDDGANEIADFIHFDTTAAGGGLLSLIHVKGSSSGEPTRQVSTSDYEVVVGQAVKNLRSLDQGNLSDGLRAGGARAVAAAIWQNGAPTSRDDFVRFLDEHGPIHDRQVVIVQPRVRRSEYEEVRRLQRDGLEPLRVSRIRQLDTLLVGAESSCRDLGASLLVIGEDDNL